MDDPWQQLHQLMGFLSFFWCVGSSVLGGVVGGVVGG